jgi:hypothetical protein
VISSPRASLRMRPLILTRSRVTFWGASFSMVWVRIFPGVKRISADMNPEYH